MKDAIKAKFVRKEKKFRGSNALLFCYGENGDTEKAETEKQEHQQQRQQKITTIKIHSNVFLTFTVDFKTKTFAIISQLGFKETRLARATAIATNQRP